MESAIAELDRRFKIPGVAQVVEGNGRLPRVRITSPDVVGEMYLHGAHVTSWKPAGGEEVLFLRAQARWQDGRAIRGGVPICFPWFGDNTEDPQAPAHGFVRTMACGLSRSRRSGVRSRSACSPKATKVRGDGGPPTFVWSIAPRSVES